MKSADGLLGPINAIEANPGQHDLRDGAVDVWTGVEFFEDDVPSVPKFEGVEGSAFGNFEFSGFRDLGGRVISLQPFLIFRMKFFDGEGENAAFATQGHEFSVIGNVVGFEAAGS